VKNVKKPAVDIFISSVTAAVIILSALAMVFAPQIVAFANSLPHTTPKYMRLPPDNLCLGVEAVTKNLGF
jgi:hypothetical protein